MYEILDVIADLYIPVLAGIFFLKCIALILRGGCGRVTGGIKVLFGLLIVSYGFMATDQYFRVFERFSLDYSTHTALALSDVVAICALSRDVLYLLVSYLCYVFLMLYQQYHTLKDILATLVLIVPFFYLCFYVVLGNGFRSKKVRL